jgi:hypothetical protein
MATYDLEALSPLEFEELIGDLLQAEMEIRFELFKPGRDSGIDLRYCLKNENIIVQCKHFFKSTYRRLEKSLESEKEKVAVLQPTRYIVATSCGLTPGNKATIRKLFHPYCLMEGDIYGRNDILKLLKDHEDVVRKNYKLWFTSEAVLRNILHSGILNQTETDLENFKELLPKLVINAAYGRIKDILKYVNTCVICGQPGIGKSTLMQLFIWHYASEGYQPIKICQNIKEAYELFNREQKQIFFYDDFLGESFLKNGLGKNEGSEICSFIQRINRMPNKKFILTTREHILNQALSQSEKLSGIKEYESVVALSDFSQVVKARILYNYLWHSKIEEKNIQKMLENKNYMRIIQHRNFNPRIIQWMTHDDKVLNENFLELFLKSLDNPDELWHHAFDSQINSYSRMILLTMGTFWHNVRSDNLWIAFKQHYPSDPFKEDELRRSFGKGIKELEGSFIKTNIYSGSLYLEFSNPSIRDFINSYLLSDKYLANTLCERAVFFNQLKQLWDIFQGGCRQNTKVVSDYVDLPLYLRSIEKLFEDNDDINLFTLYEEKVLHLLNVAVTVKDRPFVESLQKKLKCLIQRNNNGETRDSELLSTILSLVKNSKKLFSFELPVDLDELIQSSRTVITSERPTCISDFCLIKGFIDLGVAFEQEEIDLLKHRLNLVLSEGIEIDDKFDIFIYNPDEDCFDYTGSEIQGLEELEESLIAMSPLFGSCVNEALVSVQHEIEKYYESIDNLGVFDGDLLDINERSEERSSQAESEIDIMFETLNDK